MADSMTDSMIVWLAYDRRLPRADESIFWEIEVFRRWRYCELVNKLTYHNYHQPCFSSILCQNPLSNRCLRNNVCTTLVPSLHYREAAVQKGERTKFFCSDIVFKFGIGILLNSHIRQLSLRVLDAMLELFKHVVEVLTCIYFTLKCISLGSDMWRCSLEILLRANNLIKVNQR